jgi:hypothetical protein
MNGEMAELAASKRGGDDSRAGWMWPAGPRALEHQNGGRHTGRPP